MALTWQKTPGSMAGLTKGDMHGVYARSLVGERCYEVWIRRYRRRYTREYLYSFSAGYRENGAWTDIHTDGPGESSDPKKAMGAVERFATRQEEKK